jgi:hypothetical protein
MRKGIAGSSVTLRFDLRPILFVIGILMLVVGVAMLVPGMVGLALATANGPALMMAAGITIGLGGLVAAANRVPVPQMTLRQIYVLTVLAWVAVPAVAALPFVFPSSGSAIPMPSRRCRADHHRLDDADRPRRHAAQHPAVARAAALARRRRDRGHGDGHAAAPSGNSRASHQWFGNRVLTAAL